MSLLNALSNKINNKLQDIQNNTTKNKSISTIEEIKNIPIPNYTEKDNNGSPVNNIEYILHRKATEYKRNNQKELAIECLRKANEIFPYSNFSWSSKDYMRIVEFYKDFGDFEQARSEEQYILDNYSKYFAENQSSNLDKNNNAIEEFMNKNKEVYYIDGSDLVSTETTSRASTCEECSKYRGRIFSVYGKDSRFPKLPDKLRKMYIHKECKLSFFPTIFFEGPENFFSPHYDLSIDLSNSDDVIKYVNRPFVDDRTPEEKELFEQELKYKHQKIQDKKDFDWLRENLANIAPKSFGGYRKMKNSNSTNYRNLVKLAKENGYIIK